jgi:hypothetical protein
MRHRNSVWKPVHCHHLMNEQMNERMNECMHVCVYVCMYVCTFISGYIVYVRTYKLRTGATINGSHAKSVL